MPGHRIGFSIPGIFSDSCSYNHRDCERRHSSHSMNHSGTREITIAVTKSVIHAELGGPSATPRPVAIKWIGDCGQAERRNGERQEFPALGCGPGDYRGGGAHEDHLEEKHHHHADVISMTR